MEKGHYSFIFYCPDMRKLSNYVAKRGIIMSSLNPDWRPEFGEVFTWFAADKFGRISVMVNNCFGDLPKALLRINDVELLLDSMSEFIWEESSAFTFYPEDKNGDFSVDLFSALKYRASLDRDLVNEELKKDWLQMGKYSDVNLAVNKGMFVYFAIEGSNEGQDYPFGYQGVTHIGDYFRCLVPTVFSSVNDFPEPLRQGIAVSDNIDFTQDRVLDNKKINEYFSAMYNNLNRHRFNRHPRVI